MRGQRRKREEEAQEKAARESAAIAEQECGAGASAAIEIIAHHAALGAIRDELRLLPAQV